MGKYRELITKAIDKGAEEEAWVLADEVMEKLKRKHPEMYDELMGDLECLAYKIPSDEAVDIVRAMRPRGQNWSMQQVKDLCRTKGIDVTKSSECVNYYLCMNMAYNDYYDTAKMFGLQSDEEFFFSLAKDFIEDPDAKPFKVEKYFLD